jgi:hypothetical protein
MKANHNAIKVAPFSVVGVFDISKIQIQELITNSISTTLLINGAFDI